jgi:hypothetical protein
MSNYKTVFTDLDFKFEFECYHDIRDDETSSVNISITDNDISDKDVFLSLDIPTAIKLGKVLRAEINKAKDLDIDLIKRNEKVKNNFKVKPVMKIPNL